MFFCRLFKNRLFFNGLIKSLLVIFLVFSSGCSILPKTVRNLVFFPNQGKSLDLQISEEPAKSLVSIENKSDFLSSYSQVEEDIYDDLNLSSGDPKRTVFLKGYDVGFKGKINAIAIHSGKASKNSKKTSDIYIGGQDGNLVKISPNENTFKLVATGDKPIISLSISPNGKYLAVSQFSLVSLIELSSLKIIAQMTQVKGRILSLAWHPNLEYLLIGRADGTVLAWNLPEDKKYSENSTDSLEIYETESSPVNHLEFHPSGRAFFAANQLGGIFLARLRKTEKELGIDEVRSSFAFMDEGTYVLKIASTDSPINDFFLAKDGSRFFTISNDGSVQSWLVRGLQKQAAISLDKDSSLSFGYYVDRDNLQVPNIPYFITTGRALKLKFWCSNLEVYSPVTATTQVVTDTDAVDSKFDEMTLSEDELIKFLEQKTKPKGAVDNLGTDANSAFGQRGLIYESDALKESISDVEVSDFSGFVWLGEKTGKIVSFDVKGLLATKEFKEKVKRICG